MIIRARIGGRAATAAASATAGVIYAAVMLGPLLLAAPGPLRAMRTAFWHDQLGYLAIVTNAAAGDFRVLEPMTLTGISHYPRSYYVAVGAVARAFSLDPVLAWNLVSAILQVGAVVLLAVTMSTLSHRWWLGVLAPLPYFTGTLSLVTGGQWRTPLNSHATLWGPYGVLFSNNAETAGLSVITIVLCVLALVWARPASRTTRLVASTLSAAALGALSGFQTYSFLTGVYLLAAILAAVFLWRSRWWWWALSAASIGVVVIIGPVVADRFGQLPTLVFGLLFAVPGLTRGLIRTRGMLAVYGGVLAAAAAPPIIWTISGIVGGDPFLTYRVASNHDLGVVQRETVLATLPLALPVLLILVIAFARRDRVAAPALIGTVVCAILLSVNDLWGANAEPYRFWIDMFLLCGVVAAIAAARLVGGAVPAGDNGESDAGDSTEHRPPATARSRRITLVAAAALSVVVYTVSLADLIAFTTDPYMTGTWNPASSRETAIETAARTAGAEAPGLIATDSCVDPRTTKVTSQQPIAYFYLGMAWPTEVDAVSMLISGRLEGAITGEAVGLSGTAWLLSDAACDEPLRLDGIDVLEERAFPYDGGEIVLRRIAQS